MNLADSVVVEGDLIINAITLFPWVNIISNQLDSVCLRGSIPLGNHFCCENGLLSILKRSFV